MPNKHQIASQNRKLLQNISIIKSSLAIAKSGEAGWVIK
jgi:hypothetical protein